MPKLRICHSKPVWVGPSAAKLHLDAPLAWYQNLEEVLASLRHLRHLHIQIHFDRHAEHWPLGKMETFGNLSFLAGAKSLEDLELYYMQKLSDGSVLRTLPKLRNVHLAHETRFDLFWLDASAMTGLSLGLTSKIKNQDSIADMTNMRHLGIDNLRCANLGFLGRMKQLNRLYLNGKVTSLAGVGAANNLKFLRLGSLRFRDFGDFGKLRALEEIVIQSCFDFAALDPLNSPALRELTIYGTKSKTHHLRSIKPLRRLQRIEKFVFGGVIEDGDISPLLDLPRLEDCLVHPRYREAVVAGCRSASKLKAFRW